MGSRCMSTSAMGCIDPRRPQVVRANYVNLYKWPESDAEFVRSVTASAAADGHHPRSHVRVVDSYSSRQMYLRSYTFSKKETVPERTRKCLGRVKDKVVGAVHGAKGAIGGEGGDRTRKRRGGGGGMRRLKEVSCSALYAVFQRLLSCTSTVDVADDHRAL